MNFEITGAPEIIAVTHATRDQHLEGFGLPILANPDLGKVSFDKSALITDLGLLGDPILTLFNSERPDLVDDYLADVVRPDVVESHSVWSCQYAAWLDTPDFEANYRLSDDRWAAGRTQAAGCPEEGRWSIWIRTDADDEYELSRRLLTDSSQAGLSPADSSPADTVREQIERCAAAPGTWLRCQGVRRAVHRSSQSLRDNGEWSSIVDVMRESPSAAFDLPYLERGPGWADDAFGAFVEFTDR